MRLRLFGLVTVLLLVLAGCSEDNRVGQGIDADKLKGGADGPRLGETTTTEAPPPPPPTTVAPPPTTAAKAAAPATTAPRPVTTQAPATTQAGTPIALTVEIFGDNSGRPQFDPRTGAVRVGSIVRFQNQDAQPRSVEDQGGTFRSPPIAPGGFWDYKANKPGKFDYVDGTRPYAVGTLSVS